jgi:hypothetical protein
MISQIPPKIAEGPTPGTRMRPNQRASDLVRDQIPEVELRGFEPLTPSMRTRCATGLRYSPWNSGQPSKPSGLCVRSGAPEPGAPPRERSGVRGSGPATLITVNFCHMAPFSALDHEFVRPGHRGDAGRCAHEPAAGMRPPRAWGRRGHETAARLGTPRDRGLRGLSPAVCWGQSPTARLAASVYWS